MTSPRAGPPASLHKWRGEGEGWEGLLIRAWLENNKVCKPPAQGDLAALQHRHAGSLHSPFLLSMPSTRADRPTGQAQGCIQAQQTAEPRLQESGRYL